MYLRLIKALLCRPFIWVFFCYGIIFSVIFSHSVYAVERSNKPTLIVRYPKDVYFPDVIKLALDKTKALDGDYLLVEQPWVGPRLRMEVLLKQDRYIDIIWNSSTIKRDAALRAIKFNILKGINGYRFLLIHKNQQYKYDNINTLADLQQFTAASGTHWIDTDIFRRNGLPVVTTVKTENIAKMLRVKRADYISRGAYEIWRELKNKSFNDMQLEKNLLLKYDAGYYFYVNMDNERLANRILTGLNLAQADGSFDQLFFSVPSFKQGWEAVNHSNRKVILLK